MWEPRRLTTLWASTACYKDSFIFYRSCWDKWNIRFPEALRFSKVPLNKQEWTRQFWNVMRKFPEYVLNSGIVLRDVCLDYGWRREKGVIVKQETLAVLGPLDRKPNRLFEKHHNLQCVLVTADSAAGAWSWHFSLVSRFIISHVSHTSIGLFIYILWLSKRTI
jgi:hypothetical protein